MKARKISRDIRLFESNPVEHAEQEIRKKNSEEQ